MYCHTVFTNGVMSASVIVGSILLPRDELFWVKQVAVCACSHFIWNMQPKWDNVTNNKQWDMQTNKHHSNNSMCLAVSPNLPTTVGSRSTNTALGTCFPVPVSLKNVLKLSSPYPIVLSDGICPSGWIPCSRQYNSQHALPICTPACPICMDIHSLWNSHNRKLLYYCYYYYCCGVFYCAISNWKYAGWENCKIVDE